MAAHPRWHGLVELLKELRGHALWEFLRDSFSRETLSHILRYLGTIGGLVLAGGQWIQHHHGLLFFLGAIVGGVSLFSFGMVVGRKPQADNNQLPEPEQGVIEKPQPEQPKKTVRLTEEQSETIDDKNQTRTRTLRRIVEITVTVVICATIGWWFPSSYHSRNYRNASLASKSQSPDASTESRQPTADSSICWFCDSLSDSQLTEDREIRDKLAKVSNPDSATTTYTNDPDQPVWAFSNFKAYMCYGSEWEKAGRRLNGTWMKQSEAQKLGVRPYDGHPCGTHGNHPDRAPNVNADMP